jgi:hypothetical protein
MFPIPLGNTLNAKMEKQETTCRTSFSLLVRCSHYLYTMLRWRLSIGWSYYLGIIWQVVMSTCRAAKQKTGGHWSLPHGRPCKCGKLWFVKKFRQVSPPIAIWHDYDSIGVFWECFSRVCISYNCLGIKLFVKSPSLAPSLSGIHKVRKFYSISLLNGETQHLMHKTIL